MPEQQTEQQTEQQVVADATGTTADYESVANAAAAAAVDRSLDAMTDVLDESAQRGATLALSGAGQVATVGASPVAIDGEQWNYLVSQLQSNSTFGLLTLVLVAACLGALGFGYLVKGWRK